MIVQKEAADDIVSEETEESERRFRKKGEDSEEAVDDVRGHGSVATPLIPRSSRSISDQGRKRWALTDL